jgi:hypothetical protein
MTAVLTLVAVALSKSRPRTGAYAQLPLALAIFAAYQFSAAGLTSWSSRTPSAGPWAYWSLHLLAAAGACAGLMQGSQPIFRRGQPRARPQ